MLDNESLNELVGKIVKRQFSEAAIHSVNVKSDVDSDGDAVLRITIVFETSGKTLDRNKMVGLVRHIRSELTNMESDSFPLVSFISKKEAENLRLEPA